MNRHKGIAQRSEPASPRRFKQAFDALEACQEENRRLKELVVKLTEIVMRNVLDKKK